MAAMTTERLVPNYHRFEVETGLVGGEILRQALDYLWQKIEDNVFEESSVRALLAKCEVLIPNAEDFGSGTVSMAIDAGNAMCCSLEALLETSSDKIAEVCTSAVDTVDLFLQRHHAAQAGIVDTEIEGWILSHPLMQAELRYQEEDYLALTSTREVDARFISRMRQVARERGGNLQG